MQRACIKNASREKVCAGIPWQEMEKRKVLQWHARTVSQLEGYVVKPSQMWKWLALKEHESAKVPDVMISAKEQTKVCQHSCPAWWAKSRLDEGIKC